MKLKEKEIEFGRRREEATIGGGVCDENDPCRFGLVSERDHRSSLKLKHQFLRVPFEHYKKMIRANHCIVKKEVSAVISGVSDAVDSDGSKDDAVNRLTSLLSRLQGLKRKLEEGSRVENSQAQRCRARLNRLESADVENLADWNNTRLKRILVDYMLRMSYYDTTVKLAERSNIMHYILLKEAEKNRKSNELLDALDFNQVVIFVKSVTRVVVLNKLPTECHQSC